MVELYCEQCKKHFQVKAEDLARVTKAVPEQVKEKQGVAHFYGACFFKTLKDSRKRLTSDEEKLKIITKTKI